jgi:hypothetical protein
MKADQYVHEHAVPCFDVLCVCARYGGEHAAPELQKEAVYGLTELYRDQIKPARLVANPGCYPTSVQLPLYPLLKSKMIKPEDIIIDAKSGQHWLGSLMQFWRCLSCAAASCMQGMEQCLV